MTDYEPRERTPEWERAVAAHGEAALFDIIGNDFPWGGHSLELDKACGQAMMMWDELPTRLYRNGICVAQWRTIR